MVSSEWAAPNTVARGFNPEDVKAGKYGRRLNFWNWRDRRMEQAVDLGEAGQIPLEVRFHHDPTAPRLLRCRPVQCHLALALADGHWTAERVIQVDPVELDGCRFRFQG